MKKRKRTPPMNIRLGAERTRFIKLTAKAQQHGNKSEVIRRLIDREMRASTTEAR